MDPQVTMPDKLNFGADSAETDQYFLSKVFLYTSLFERVRSGKKHLVLGRKGTGKTAVCLKLYEYLGNQGARVSLITPRDLQRFRTAMLEKVSLNSGESSLLAWKYVFLVQMARYLLEDAQTVYGNNYLGWPESLRQIRTFIAQYEGGKTSWIERTFHILSNLKTIGIKTPVAEASVDIQDSKQEAHEHDFDDKLNALTKNIHTSLQSLSITPIYMLVDKVDEIWDPTPESKLLIIGLLRAMKEILDKFGSVHAVVFLRSDIYESLEFNDSDKYHGMEERVRWSKRELQEMLTLRAALSTNSLSEVRTPQGVSAQSIHSTWRTFFPNRINNENSFDYLLRFTFMRPRDLIQLCNLCRDRAQDKKHAKIEREDIDEALPDYSQWKLQDLRDEYKIQYPFLETLFLTVFYNTAPRLDRESIQRLIEPFKRRLADSYGLEYFTPLDKLLQLLYNIGFLGAIDKEAVRYSFRGERVFIPYISLFEIHPVFRWALTTSTAIIGTFSSLPSEDVDLDLFEDYSLAGTVREGTPAPLLSQPDTEGVVRLRKVIMETYSHKGDIERLLVSLRLPYDILGSGSLSRQAQELINYCLRRNRYQDLIRQLLIEHPERAKDIL